MGNIIFLAFFAALQAAWLAKTAEPPPNIIVLQADDLGYDDLGIHGNAMLETPNLDALAKTSVQFRQFYVTPVCATTRAALLTGRHHLRTGVSHVHGGKDFMALEETTLAQVLKKAGYTTGMWGKWHTGKTEGYFPWQRGFDEAFMARLYQYNDNAGVFNGSPVKTDGWVTRVLTDYAIDFIERNRQGPFFAYVPYLTCHAPLRAPAELVAKYQQKGLSPNLALLYAMIDHLDFHIGRLLAKVDELGLAERTIVIFMSDNGPAIIHDYLSDSDRRLRYVNRLRGHKGNIWENGIRSPLFIRRTGHFSPAVVDRLVDVTDIFPTLAALAGAPVDEPALDGRSVVPYVHGDTGSLDEKWIFLYAHPAWGPTDKPWTPEGILNEYEPVNASNRERLLAFDQQVIGIRNERYKLLKNPSSRETPMDLGAGRYALIDIRQDPREELNLAEQESEVFQHLHDRLLAACDDVFTSPNAFAMPVFQIARDPDRANEVLAYAPHSIGGSPVNAYNFLYQWRQAGDLARYLISVNASGYYRPVLHFQAPEAGQYRFGVNASGTVSSSTLSEESPVAFPALWLEQGTRELTLSLTAPPGKVTSCKLFRLVLEPVNGKE